MKETLVWTVQPDHLNQSTLEAAGALLRAGKLVAFPTETVYGLGANALDEQAVAGIFKAKGRPATNPLIVHIASLGQVSEVASIWPEAAQKLAARYWPGPLTLIVPKAQGIPLVVTAGGPTVGVRMPAHPVALALLQAAQVPVAAPSANRSTEISPTTARHVLKGLKGRVDLVVDGGPTQVGIESTVLDVSGEVPILWREGMISRTELEQVIGPVKTPAAAHNRQGPAASPGQERKHYAPKAEVLLQPFGQPETIAETIRAMLTTGIAPSQIGALTISPLRFQTPVAIYHETLPLEASRYAERLYGTLHHLEDQGVTHLVIEAVPAGSQWDGIRDRLQRAAAK
ncbi:MAG: threonylcarbamoyl-AMP synthase [Blastocatellia bacterium]|nr:threonylcarbamoyl-AMP synthase [Blastocatellia bacterium]